MNLTFAANLTKMIDAGLGREAAPPETFVAVGRTTEYTDLGPVPIASFETNVEAPLRALSLSMEPIQAGTGDPSPDNVRPISGRQSVTVTRSGKNLLPDDMPIIAQSKVPVNKSNCFFVKAGTYVASFRGANFTSFRWGIYMFDADGNALLDTAHKPSIAYGSTGTYWRHGSDSQVYNYNGSGMLTIVEDCYIRFVVTLGDVTATSKANNAQLEKGGSITAYEAPTIQTVTLQLGQTVYGGTLDVVSGVLTVDRVMYEYDGSEDEGWAYGNNRFYINNLQKKEQTPISNRLLGQSPRSHVNIADNAFALTTGAANYINFRKDDITSLEDWKAWLAENPVQMLMELVTPLTVQLTPEQITTLIGQNNVWSDGGNVSLTYGTTRYTEGY